MRRFWVLFLFLLFLTSCAAPASPEPEPIPTSLSEADDLTLPIGRRLPLPVTEGGLRDYYSSPEGFSRHVLGIRASGGDYLVCSVPLPCRDTGGLPDRHTRFDYVYGRTGYCYALLEGRYTMDQVTHIGQGSLDLETQGSDLYGPVPAYVSACLGWQLLEDQNTGEPAEQRGLYCAAQVYSAPLQLPLADGPLAALGTEGASAPLAGVFPGSDALELLFDTSDASAVPRIELSYAQAARELTILCQNVSLDCAPSGGNLYVESLRAEQRGADAAVICTLRPAFAESDALQEANSVELAWAYLPGRDFRDGALRLTFFPFMG